MNKIETRIIGLIQMACTNDPKQNLQNAIDSIREAAKKGAQIICLPELFLSRYFCQTENPEHFSLAEPIPGPTSNSLAKLAKELETVLIVPLFEKRTEGIYHNSAVVIDANGSLSGTYRKMHIPDDPCFYEKYYFTPGDNGFKSFSTRYGKIGVLICWDQWFPEAARLTALTGAQFYSTLLQSAIRKTTAPNLLTKLRHGKPFKNLMQFRMDYLWHPLTAGGKEDDLTFWGRSFVCNPFGNVLQQANENKEEIIIASCSLSEIESIRQNWPFLRDRRIDTYQNLNKLFLDSDE